MSDEYDIPDDWIPLRPYEEVGNPKGGLFLDASGSMLTLIRNNENKPNDVIRLWNAEVPDLIHRLVDYEAEQLEEVIERHDGRQD